jgi:Ssp1 endopeptidase immunity protein Rap1a
MIINRLSAVILAACALWSAPAHSEQVDFSANGFMPGCRFFIERGGAARAREMQLVYDSGRCHGFVSAVALTDLGVCLPAGATIDQMMRVVVRYVDARPERAHEAFATLAQEALRAAWPCMS